MVCVGFIVVVVFEVDIFSPYNHFNFHTKVIIIILLTNLDFTHLYIALT